MLEQISRRTIPATILSYTNKTFAVILACLNNTIRSCLYHLCSLWLFTFSDLKTIVVPSSIFGVANALAAENYGLQSLHPVTYSTLLQRTPSVVLFVWLNLLPFAINNQINEHAVQEDAVNKPWRTMPSKRMTRRQARRLMIVLYAAAMGLSFFTRGFRQSTALLILGFWYNNLGGGDGNYLVRNTINAFGYVCFTSGAMEVALGSSLPMNTSLARWFAVLAGIILTTVHLQDMYDQAGDKLRGRKTAPLVLGDRLTRWLTAIPMITWGYASPRLWGLELSLTLPSLLLAVTVVARSLLFTSVEQDRLTFKFWNLWIGLIFLLPLLKQSIA